MRQVKFSCRKCSAELKQNEKGYLTIVGYDKYGYMCVSCKYCGPVRVEDVNIDRKAK